MARTINNPLSWTGRLFSRGSHHIGAVAEEFAGKDTAPIDLRTFRVSDIRPVLSKGLDDFLAFRTDVVFLIVIYPLIGVLLTFLALHRNLLPLVFPLIAGFALLGPLAAVGLYEMSRCRERGIKTSWLSAFGIIGSPSLAPIIVLGGYLCFVFLVWLFVANLIYDLTLGPLPPASLAGFAGDIFTTAAGWTMLVAGVGTGFVFAVMVLAVSVISFPLLVDRNVGLLRAVVASATFAWRNPVAVAAWGAVVAAGLAVGVLTLFVGLIFILPILGHATWHLYRRAVVRAG